jgi:hypothetical protein
VVKTTFLKKQALRAAKIFLKIIQNPRLESYKSYFIQKLAGACKLRESFRESFQFKILLRQLKVVVKTGLRCPACFA